MRAGAFVLAVVLSSCIGRDTDIGSSAARDFASGSRLRARIYVMDGAAVLAGFHDRELGIDCTFGDENGEHLGPSMAGHRVRTCLPTALARHREGVGPYADLGCTKKAGFVVEGEAPDYGVNEPVDACASGPVVHRAGEVERGRPFWTIDSEGECTRRTGLAFARLEEAVPDGTFVRAEETVEPRGGRIAARVLRSADGARQVIGGWDAVRDAAVTPVVTEDGVRRWAPVDVAFVGGQGGEYVDASCTLPAATKIRRNAVCPLSAGYAFVGSCRARFHRLGVEREQVIYRRDDAGVCTKTLASSFVYEVGDAILSSVFEPVVFRESGFGRVRRRGVATAGGDLVTLDTIVDARAGVPCAPALVAGRLRCAPVAKAAVLRFADAACTELAFEEVFPCEADEPSTRVRSADDAHVYEVVREVPIAYEMGPAGCERHVTEVPVRVFALRELDPATLPPAEPRVE